MPPPKTKRLTAQPVRKRLFAGKPAAPEAEEPSSEEESAEEEEQPKPKPFLKPKPAPIASSFPKAALKPNLVARQKSEAERKRLEEEFETASEEEEEEEAASGEEGSESESGSGSEEESSEEEEESSEEEAPKKLLRPVFLKKNQRNQVAAPVKTAEEIAAEEERRRQEETRALVQEQIEQRAAAKAAAHRDWDDDVEEADINAVDDTDGLDPPAEYAAWKLRELKRIKRERLAIEEAEAERAEIERRKNLTAEEREAEDRAFLEKQQEERTADRGKISYMQKYFHKGAFFQEDLAQLGLDKRNVMGARFEDQTDRAVLPEYMQIRDMTKLGKKGRTKYKDMKSEDTGTWGDFGDIRRGPRDKSEYGLDERFRSDRDGGRAREREGATGANARPLGERKRGGEETMSRDSKRPRVDERG